MKERGEEEVNEKKKRTITLKGGKRERTKGRVEMRQKDERKKRKSN